MSHLHQFDEPGIAPQRQVGVTRRMLITLGIALAFLAILLSISAPQLLALPSETLISQRAQTETQAGNTSVSATYGEIVTVTLRFTITTGTVLTGPVEVATRFTAPGGQLGLRFLGYQGPIGAGGSEPALVPTSFVSPTVGNTTYLTWTFGTITNMSGSPYVYEIPYQVRFGWNGTLDAQTNVQIAGANTYIRWSPYTANDRKTAANLTINRVIPNLNPPYSTKTVAGAIQSNGTVVYTVMLKNGNNTTGFSTAYELVIPDSLDSHLTYVGASPTPDSISPIVPGQNTVLTWTASSLAPNATWVAYVTATLPATFTANAAYLNTVSPVYTTLPANQPDEGTLTAVIVKPISATVAATKRANPASFVRIGDEVAYTVQFTVPAQAGLWSPIFTDTLPDGFHYRAGTFSLTGATLNGAVVTKTTSTREQIVWQWTDMPPNGSVQVITVAYVADVTGRKTDGTAAYAPPTTGQVNADNAVAGTWRSDTGEVISLGTPLVGRTTIAQPFLNSLSKSILIWPQGNAEEIGSPIIYEITLINNGPITAYEVLLNDLLPPGMVFKQTVSVIPANLTLTAQPADGDTGTVQWAFQEIPKTTVKLQFRAIVSDTAKPGDTLSNTVSVADYTSQPGDGNPYDRHYNTIAGALPNPGRIAPP